MFGCGFCGMVGTGIGPPGCGGAICGSGVGTDDVPVKLVGGFGITGTTGDVPEKVVGGFGMTITTGDGPVEFVGGFGTIVATGETPVNV